MLSIAVFKKLGKSTILENNIVQTIGSAGESIAAGCVFTLPALLFLNDGPEYFNFFVMVMAGVGVLFIFVAMAYKEKTHVREND